MIMSLELGKDSSCVGRASRYAEPKELFTMNIEALNTWITEKGEGWGRLAEFNPEVLNQQANALRRDVTTKHGIYKMSSEITDVVPGFGPVSRLPPGGPPGTYPREEPGNAHSYRTNAFDIDLSWQFTLGQMDCSMNALLKFCRFIFSPDN